MSTFFGLFAVLVLVAANGFFVAAEFSMVAVRRSRVAELVAAKRANAATLERALYSLDSYLAATQLGITISSLALGWLGEPALAHLIEPPLTVLLGSYAGAGAHAIAVAIAFIIITVLHIVLGELAPKSLALQRSEATALWVVRPLGLFLFLLRPAIITLNGAGNLLLRWIGLQPGTGEATLHSAEELKLLVNASQEAGLLHQTQQEVVERVLNIGDRRISSIMTPRTDVDWIDLDDDRETILKTIQACQHEQVLVARGSIDEPLGMILTRDLLNQALSSQTIDPSAVLRSPLVVPESTSVFRVLDQFKKAPVRMIAIVDEYGILQGIVTQTDLLEAFAGDLPDAEGEEPDVVTRDDGSLLIEGTASAQDVFDRLGIQLGPDKGDFHTIAGFALVQLRHLPVSGEHFDHSGWRFEVVDMDGRRIDKLLVTLIAKAKAGS